MTFGLGVNGYYLLMRALLTAFAVLSLIAGI